MDKTANNASSSPRWGALNREKKAVKIMRVISEMSSINFNETNWLDIGCGSGGIAAHISPYIKSMTGIDPEPWERWDEYRKSQKNLTFLNESIDSLSCKDNSFDVIICNQVYEHVPDPVLLINEIHRMLKPGGVCYFAGPNLLFPIEPHVFWPFIHWLPRDIAVKLMKRLGSKKVLDAYSTDYWHLKKWLRSFTVKNAIPFIIKDTLRHKNNLVLPRWVDLISELLIEKMTFISPGFIFLIEKKKI